MFMEGKEFLENLYLGRREAIAQISIDYINKVAGGYQISFYKKIRKSLFRFLCDIKLKYTDYMCSQLDVRFIDDELAKEIISSLDYKKRQIHKDESDLCDLFSEWKVINMIDLLNFRMKEAYQKEKRGISAFEDIESAIIMATHTEGIKRKAFDVIPLSVAEYVMFNYRISMEEQAAEQKKKYAEELRALRELKREKEQAEKDAAKAQAAIEKNKESLLRAKTDAQIEKLNNQIAELETALKRAIERKERAISMAQQTRCGYVYIISNIGSFGEGIYKIGMTRRLDPMDRVRELGDASVPFPFDVHAMIYTEDAPGLETHLHKAFENKKVNTVNWRKEYFRVSLDEIRGEVEAFGINCKWENVAEAAQWRESESMRKYECVDEFSWAKYIDEHPEVREELKVPFAYDPFGELDD